MSSSSDTLQEEDECDIRIELPKGVKKQLEQEKRMEAMKKTNLKELHSAPGINRAVETANF